MMLGCPKCGAKFKWNEAEVAGVLVEMADVAAKLGAHWELVSEYVDCFRPNADGQVTLKKRLRVLREVAKLIESKEFQHDKKRYRTDVDSIRWAMRMICDRQLTAFSNHKYLKKTLLNAGYGARVSAEGLTAKEEQEKYERPTSNAQRPTSNDEELMTLPEHRKKHAEGGVNG